MIFLATSWKLILEPGRDTRATERSQDCCGHDHEKRDGASAERNAPNEVAQRSHGNAREAGGR